jgi:hypothetical protein
VTSPTFTLIHEYPGGRLPLFHFDLYRLDTADELLRIGFDDYLDSAGVLAIEWADKFPTLLPPTPAGSASPTAKYAAAKCAKARREAPPEITAAHAVRHTPRACYRRHHDHPRHRHSTDVGAWRCSWTGRCGSMKRSLPTASQRIALRGARTCARVGELRSTYAAIGLGPGSYAGVRIAMRRQWGPSSGRRGFVGAIGRSVETDAPRYPRSAMRGARRFTTRRGGRVRRGAASRPRRNSRTAAALADWPVSPRAVAAFPQWWSRRRWRRACPVGRSDRGTWRGDPNRFTCASPTSLSRRRFHGNRAASARRLGNSRRCGTSLLNA